MSRAATAALTLAQVDLDAGRYTQALESLRMAARSGDGAALNMLGRCAERGWGMDPDPAQAAGYYRKAILTGEPWAMFNLAELHLRGEGVLRDPAAARDLYAQAARKGLLQALNMLGMLAEDEAEARAYFRAGAEGGDPWAMFNHACALAADGQQAEARDWIARSRKDAPPGYLAMLDRARLDWL
ncbi:MAG: tetratricopeptide repeat protein [Paracoccus sp. (in: a-proteobacteria)]|uniref:tetratricopeptide repeat protein n=1 Tax=Paracoccus sp. TaxID=267 RepID=UPI0026DF5073|nr:tetratricopeptide repeat protein [Paracoccus sp. (in: a-proteobacteria)]MDO5622496.1 tetratricopeptide repeat protein [Paracoccus sp. (in: a-proteobacteria)]